jgi:hypothetical protein
LLAKCDVLKGDRGVPRQDRADGSEEENERRQQGAIFSRISELIQPPGRPIDILAKSSLEPLQSAPRATHESSAPTTELSV